MTETVELPALLPALPEIVLAVGAMVLLMVGAFRGEQATRGIDGAAILLLIAHRRHRCLAARGQARHLRRQLRGRRLCPLPQASGADRLGGGDPDVVRLISRREKQQKFEYSILILLSTTGMMMLISAADLIALYLGLELMSLALYVVAAIDRDSVRSTEAGLKYFVLGALSSGMLLYGASLIYGFTGTVSFAGIAKAASSAQARSLGLIFGLVFLFAGFCFKVSAVPFHMWTPDVYEGAPTPITAFFAAAPKVAGIAMFVRTTIVAFPGILTQWQQIVVFVAIASMALGAFAAIGQRNIKRLMAYSSIGHMGFALIGLAAGTAGRRAGRAGLYGDLCRHDARHLRLHPVDAPRRADGRGDRRSRRACAHQADDGVLPRHAAVLARRHSAARGLLRQVLRVPGRHQGRALHARRDRRAHQRGGRLLLSAIVKIMYFDEPAKPFEPMPHELRAVLAVTGLFNLLFFVYPGAADRGGQCGGEVAVLNAA